MRNIGQLKGAALISLMIVLPGAEIQNDPGYLGDNESVARQVVLLDGRLQHRAREELPAVEQAPEVLTPSPY